MQIVPYLILNTDTCFKYLHYFFTVHSSYWQLIVFNHYMVVLKPNIFRILIRYDLCILRKKSDDKFVLKFSQGITDKIIFVYCNHFNIFPITLKINNIIIKQLESIFSILYIDMLLFISFN